MHYKYHKTSAIAVLTLLVLMQSCAWVPPAEVEHADLDLPTEYRLYQAGRDVSPEWWKRFHSPELDSLIDIALMDNLTLAQALSRLQQAEATARQSGASRIPSLNLSAGTSQTKTHTDTGSAPAAETTSEAYSLGLAASWELDLWGRVNATARAGSATLTAAGEDLYAARQSVVAELTLTWLELIAASQSVALLKQQLEDQEALLELSELGYRKGYYDALSLQQQRLSTAERRSAIPSEVVRRENLRQQLNLLLGRPPMSALVLRSDQLPVLQELPVAGLPADLLSQRPDLRALGQRLYALEWSLKAARAARLPALSLSASGSYSSGDYDLLFDKLGHDAGWQSGDACVSGRSLTSWSRPCACPA